MHTPGPWLIEVEKTKYGPEIFVCIESGDPICQLCDMVEQTEANARLIAAAPALLEACKFFGLLLGAADAIRRARQGDVNGLLYDTVSLEHAAKIAIAAIAKAEEKPA